MFGIETKNASSSPKIFNLRNRTEHGALHHSDGTVNALAFYVDDRHVITASEDCNICIVKTSSWRVEKTLVKHKVRPLTRPRSTGMGGKLFPEKSLWGLLFDLDFIKAGVVDVSIHPSGKMALSVGKDKKLVTWNLVRNHLLSKDISIPRKISFKL